MEIWWVLIAVLLVSIYFVILTGYRLWLSVRSLIGAIGKTNQLLSELRSVEEFTLDPATAASIEDLDVLLRKRRNLLKLKRQRQAERQRRLVNRVREIDIDKRWA